MISTNSLVLCNHEGIKQFVPDSKYYVGLLVLPSSKKNIFDAVSADFHEIFSGTITFGPASFGEGAPQDWDILRLAFHSHEFGEIIFLFVYHPGREKRLELTAHIKNMVDTIDSDSFLTSYQKKAVFIGMINAFLPIGLVSVSIDLGKTSNIGKYPLLSSCFIGLDLPVFFLSPKFNYHRFTIT